MKKAIYKTATSLAIAAAISVAATSCSDSKTYAELLTDENQVTNAFLADQRVSNTIPTDTLFEFEVGEDAPYYRMDEDGNAYMQVVKMGTPGNYAKDDEIIYFRFTRYNLNYYEDGELDSGDGNDEDMSYDSCWFRMNNFTLESSYKWGSGIQLPLTVLPIDSEVNIVIKSQLGVYSEMSYVIPYLFHVRYYKPKT
jgi:hypothetical protein